MFSYSSKLIFGGILSLVPFGSGIPFLLNSINETNKLNQVAPHWNKLIEIWVYGKNNEKIEKIKVWIENLNDTSKDQYFDIKDWKEIKNNNKYSYLAKLAKDYLLVQHRINVFSSLKWLNKDKQSLELNKVSCTKCDTEQCPTKTELSCFLKCCQKQTECENKNEIIYDQQAFAAYLTNIYSPWNSTYFQPLQAHIYLKDLDFSTNENSKLKPKMLTGTTVYGFTDYYYKENENPNLEEYKTLIKINKNNSEKKKYFINYPQTFKLDDNNLEKIKKDIEKNKNWNEKNHQHQGEICDSLECKISKNYVKSLNTLEQPFKNISNCNKQE